MSAPSPEDVHVALRDNENATVGEADGTQEWARTADVGMALHLPWSRTRIALEHLEMAGRARRHPSGADLWQALPR